MHGRASMRRARAQRPAWNGCGVVGSVCHAIGVTSVHGENSLRLLVVVKATEAAYVCAGWKWWRLRRSS